MMLPLLLTLFFGSTRYPLQPDGLCGATRTCASVMDSWNAATWAAVVDDDIQSGGPPLAAVRWYDTEGECSGPKCEDQLQVLPGKSNDVDTHHFGGVTDEFGNVLLSHAMGSDQVRYEKLRNFAELLRHPDINNLQCWKYHVGGKAAYDSYSQLCYLTDSASDASIRILGAYGIACAKQRGGVWPTTGFENYCADYERQGNAIWGRGTAMHGEIKRLPNGEAYLANGFNNQTGAPTTWQAFRPDYYELQFLMDFAVYENDASLRRDVIDMLNDYLVSTGENAIHRGKTGSFNADTTAFTCGELCSPAYMDNTDTWRAIPALSGLLTAHPSLIPSPARALYDQWWTRYAGGNPAYPAVGEKPFEINADGPSPVRQTDARYKVYGMWIPLGIHYDAQWVRDAVGHLVDVEYQWSSGYFDTAQYYGAYYSQFAQRAIGSATGLMDPASYVLSPPSNLIATATSSTTVSVSWAGVTDADAYDVVRSSDGDAYVPVLTTASTSFVDDTVVAGKTYLYKVRTVSGIATSSFSVPEYATTVFFTDDPLQPGITSVKASHILELRTAANALRSAAGLTDFSFTDSTLDPAASPVRAVHLSDLRSALAAAFEALGLGAIGYVDPVITAGTTTIRADHVEQLRSAIE